MASMDNLNVTVADAEPVLVAVDGQIDSHTAVGLDDALAEIAADRNVSVDLSAVSFIDSSGLRVLVRAEKRHSGGGGALTLLSPSEAVARLLEITGLATELTIDSP